MSSAVSQKTELRKKFRVILQTLEQEPPEQKQTREKNLSTFLGLLLSMREGCWGAFQALPGEPHLKLEDHPHLEWVYPRIEKGDLQFYKPHSAQNFISNEWGIREPDPQNSQKIDVENLSGVLVPGLAFDSKGRRLGRGRGFYDRALQAFRKPKVGIGFREQISEAALPREDFDVCMDWIVTDSKVIQV